MERSRKRLLSHVTATPLGKRLLESLGNVETMSYGTFSGGTVVGAGLVSSRGAIEFTPEGGLAPALGQDIHGNSEVLALTIQCSSSEDATGLIGWNELV